MRGSVFVGHYGNCEHRKNLYSQLIDTIRKLHTAGNFSSTVVSCKFAHLFCILALGKTGEGAYVQDRDIST